MTYALNDPTVYYRFSSDLYGLNEHVTAGLYAAVPNNLFLGPGYSSENWQVFYQDNIYFLRNHDYGDEYQLGINLRASPSQPRLLPTSGDLSQQWNMTLWPDGTRKLVNMAVGEFQFLGVSNTSDGVIIPVMNTAERGSHWTFDINTSAGQTSEEMQSPLSSVATPSFTASSTISVTTSSPTTLSSTTLTPITSTPPAASVSSAPHKSSSSLSGGAIAGIVVGAVVLLTLAILTVFFVIKRRRGRSSPPDKNPPPSTSEKTRAVEAFSERQRAELPAPQSHGSRDHPIVMSS